MGNSRLVYSTDQGRICPGCHKSAAKCVCKQKKTRPSKDTPNDGIIRIQREVKGRKGKCVTTISGFQHNDFELKQIANQLKRRCGTGGTYKDGIIIIQGDHRSALQTELVKQGYKVKLSGG